MALLEKYLTLPFCLIFGVFMMDKRGIQNRSLPSMAELNSAIALFWEFDKYFGEEVCGILAYSLGKALGERLYKLFSKRSESLGLSSANAFLIRSFKDMKLVRDAAAFISRSEEGEVEIFFRVASCAQIWGKRSRPYLYVLRGTLFQFYSMLTSSTVRIRSRDLSDTLKDCYEYVIRISCVEDPRGGGDEQG